jgi:glucose/arabinose dehydrogenase
MKPLPSFSFFAIIAFAAAAFLATTTHNGGNLLRAQDAKGDAANAAKQGAVQGKGAFKGKAPVDTLGAGPWDIKTEAATVRVSVVTKGLDHPWGMAFVPGSNDILVTERPGRLRLVRNGVLDPTPIGALPEIRAVTLGGLLDIALHPNFAQNRLIYFSYSKPGAEEPARATLAVARARWDGGARLTELKDVFVADAYHGGRGAPKGCCGQGPSDGSYGSRILFDNAGFLYITSGDRNYGEKSQDPMSHIGKILRLKDDGSVPPDNPFVGKPWVKPEIYTIGHRNPLGLTLHPVTGEIWESEFGPRGGDEINRIVAGKNYGWIAASKGTHYNGTPGGESEPGWIDPVMYFIPSINPGNLVFYNGDKFPAWKGNLLMATMTRSVLRVPFDPQGKPMNGGGGERMFTQLGQRFRDIRVAPDGLIYLLTDETFGAMLKLEPGQ